MAQRKTAKLRINGDGKFDAVDADGEIVYADIANGLRAVRIISSLEGDGIDTLLLETYEGKSKRRFNIKAKDLSIESRMRSELLNNQYYIGANFSRYLMNYLLYNLQAVQKQSRITYRHRSLGFYMDEHGEHFFCWVRQRPPKVCLTMLIKTKCNSKRVPVNPTWNSSIMRFFHTRLHS